MKLSSEVSADKLRGGFYTPAALVRVCLDRVSSLLGGAGPLRVLEPSAGDGAFLAGLAGHDLGRRVAWATAVEIVAAEAAAARHRLAAAPFPGEVVQDDFLRYASAAPFDVAVGNPPFVRYQFVDEAEREHMLALGRRFGVEFRGVANLWLPVLVGALGSLRAGGVFAFVVPAESFTGIAGNAVREWLLSRVEALHVDLFAPGSFPGVLQEVVVLSGQMGLGGTRDLHLREHSPSGVREWAHAGVGRFRTWTRFLLSPRQVESLRVASDLPAVSPLGEVARFEVATVTGANAFFCVPDATVARFGLDSWSRPLLPRTRHAAGLSYTAADHCSVRAEGLSASLLDFSADRPDPMLSPGARDYLAAGASTDLPDRYKCRIREPWYRVPVVAPGALMMAKRSHLHPRVIVNDAGVVTTDTIYRGRLLASSPRGFAASFHNSLTLLTAEIEGRSFGGGVLELVPSEIARLSVPVVSSLAGEFDRLDSTCRAGGDLVDETDRLLLKAVPGLTDELTAELREALGVLQALRLARN